jgi:hypothetical protein
MPAWKQANRGVRFSPPSGPLSDGPAAIEIAGAIINVWLDADGVVQIAANLAAVEDWVRQPDGKVALRLAADNAALFEGRHRPAAHLDGLDSLPADADGNACQVPRQRRHGPARGGAVPEPL